MMIGLIIVCFIFFAVFGIAAMGSYKHEDEFAVISLFTLGIAIILCVIGCFNGVINYPKTEGTHQGVVTAVDLEGVYFRRYEVYLKSSGHTTQSDETVYKIYDYETDLANQLKDCIGKEVKLNYGHDGGYIGWNSCGTYHIKSIEVIERKQVEENGTSI